MDMGGHRCFFVFMQKVIEPVGIYRGCYGEKFGVPRQAGLVKAAWGRVELMGEYAREEAVRTLGEFSHVWVGFGFDQAKWEGALTVRPPRLGGDERVGVFASRSPFRPNGLGLSAVKLEEVICEEGKVSLRVSGGDLVDGTPVYDVKPYVPYADAVEGAEGAWAGERPELLKVDDPNGILLKLDERVRRLIGETLAQDVRPAVHEDEERVYGVFLAGINVRFRVDGGVCEVISCEN